MSTDYPSERYISEAEALRRLNVTQHRAAKLRAARVLVPDMTIGAGRCRLYLAARVPDLATKINPPVAASVGHASPEAAPRPQNPPVNPAVAQTIS